MLAIPFVPLSPGKKAEALSHSPADPRPSAAGTDTPASLTVCPTCELRDLTAAVQTAIPGSTVVVEGGRYEGPISIDKPIRVIGKARPEIDGTGAGSVVRITSPDVYLEGFIVTNSGSSHDREDAGIVVSAPRVTVVGNEIRDALFGIYLHSAEEGLIQGNVISSKQLPEAARGDGIKLWYSPRSRLIDNVVRGSRDVLVWFCEEVAVVGNYIEGGRYGLHFMYSHKSTIERNVLIGNSVGIYLMYGSEQRVSENTLINNRGPSGYGIALKETDVVLIEQNFLEHNRAGIFLDNSPVSLTARNRISANWIGYNDIGMLFTAATSRNSITRNSFVDNLEQVSIDGGYRLGGIEWSDGGAGNFWSDYVGFDSDGDGIGDLPYRNETLLGSLTDRYPDLNFFRLSLASSALDIGTRAVPLFLPEPKLVDPAPLIQAVPPFSRPNSAPRNSSMHALASVALIATGSSWYLWLMLSARMPKGRRPSKRRQPRLPRSSDVQY